MVCMVMVRVSKISRVMFRVSVSLRIYLTTMCNFIHRQVIEKKKANTTDIE